MLIGHSTVGCIFIVKAYEDARVSKVISWAGVSDYVSRFGTEGKIAQWEKDGVMYVINGRTKQEMPHYYQFYKNFKANEARLNIKNATNNLKIAHCIIHGNRDESVSIKEAEKFTFMESKQ